MEGESPRALAGVCVADKPSGITSLDVVRRLRRHLPRVRMGHTGTLDPLATGVLPVCMDEGTKLVPFMRLEPKKYEGRFLLGVETDTWDVTGKVLDKHPVPPLRTDELEQVFSDQEGVRELEPPVFSAIKHKGRPLYAYARKGKPVTPLPRKATIQSFRLTDREGDDVVCFELVCGRGTYVRSVVHEIGRRLGCGACLLSLRRLACGRFRIEDALPLDLLEASVKEGRLAEILLPPSRVLDHLRAYEVLEEGARKMCNGIPLRVPELGRARGLDGHIGEKVRILVRGELVAVAEIRRDGTGGTVLQPIRVLRFSCSHGDKERQDPSNSRAARRHRVRVLRPERD